MGRILTSVGTTSRVVMHAELQGSESVDATNLVVKHALLPGL